MITKRIYGELIEEYEKLKKKLNKKISDYNDVIDCYYELKDDYDNLILKFNKLLKKNNENIEIIKNQNIKNNQNQEKIKKLKNEISYEKEAKFALREFFSKEHSNWHVEAGLAWRFKLTDGKIERYVVPKSFNINRVENLTFDDDFYMCSFKYDTGRMFDNNYFKIPCSLYQYLGGELFSNNSECNSNFEFREIRTISDLEKLVLLRGGSIKGKHLRSFLHFYLSKYNLESNNRFTKKEYNIFFKHINRETRRQYLKKLIEWGLIYETSKDLYECKPFGYCTN